MGAIGTGTTNLTVNVPADAAPILRRAAARAGARSLSQYLSHLIHKGLAAQDPQAAARLAEVRRRYYGATLTLLFVGAFVVPVLAGRQPEDLRRPAPRPRLTRRHD